MFWELTSAGVVSNNNFVEINRNFIYAQFYIILKSKFILQKSSLTLAPIKCEEDDDFMSAFDRMMSDTLLEHTREATATQLSLPLVARAAQQKKTYGEFPQEIH